MFTLAVAVPMVTALLLVGTPALQFPAVPQLLSPEVPVHESAVRAGGALRIARPATARFATGCCLTTDCCESLRFDFADCAATKPLRLKTTARRQRAVIRGVTARDDGRMETLQEKNLRAQQTGSWHNVHGQKTYQWPPDVESTPSPL